MQEKNHLQLKIKFSKKSPKGKPSSLKTTWLFLFPLLAVEIFVDIAELFIGHVGVDLGGGYVGMAEEGLDGAEVGAVA